MKGQGRLYCAGWAVWDVRLRVESFPPTSARTRVLERREDVGGPATVAALAAASLGTPALLLAHTGGDAGEKIRARLEALGGQAVLGATPDFITPIYTVLVAPDGERFIFREALPEPAVPDELPQLGAEDVLLLDCRAPRLALKLAHQAHDIGARVVLDFDRDEPEAWQLAELSSHIVADEALTMQLGGFAALRSRLPNAEVVAATLGAAGVQTVTERIPAYRVDVLDSTGAGDVFHGAYAAALLNRHPAPFRYAAAAAAVRCRSGDLPTPQTVLSLMESQ
ncbi:sulfofructose kinase [Deinococcus rubellus]|uniref:PfkB family carbohydrate kinase n=1 Tax=Deinococcus rubellus TaxID=1889240 RepID=UPI0031E98237